MLSFICFSQNNWEKRRARKQQFMLHLALRDDVERVFYIEPPLNLFRILLFPLCGLKGRADRLRLRRAMKFSAEPSQESEKLFIFTPLFFIPFSMRVQFIYNCNLYLTLKIIRLRYKRLGFKNIVLWLYHPFDYCLLKWFNERCLACFDWAEEWSDYFNELSGPRRREILRLEEIIIKKADLVFTVSSILLERAGKWNKHSYHLFDGTVPEIFLGGGSSSRPEELSLIRNPILGYLGTINERLDLRLLKLVREELPSVSVVLIGDIHHQRIKDKGLLKINGLHFLGGKKYEELGRFTRFFDVCILPYRFGEALNISPPTKIFDYLATGKPVVSTFLSGIERFKGFILVAHSHQEFIACIKQALGGESEELAHKRIQEAKANSWSRRAEEIISIIKSQL